MLRIGRGGGEGGGGSLEGRRKESGERDSEINWWASVECWGAENEKKEEKSPSRGGRLLRAQLVPSFSFSHGRLSVAETLCPSVRMIGGPKSTPAAVNAAGAGSTEGRAGPTMDEVRPRRPTRCANG